VLDSVGGNHAEAARRLRINRTSLYERIELAQQRLAVTS
jgi:transcriptional regulator with PAS, ATPase and Fis domain